VAGLYSDSLDIGHRLDNAPPPLQMILNSGAQVAALTPNHPPLPTYVTYTHDTCPTPMGMRYRRPNRARHAPYSPRVQALAVAISLGLLLAPLTYGLSLVVLVLIALAATSHN